VERSLRLFEPAGSDGGLDAIRQRHERQRRVAEPVETSERGFPAGGTEIEQRQRVLDDVGAGRRAGDLARRRVGSEDRSSYLRLLGGVGEGMVEGVQRSVALDGKLEVPARA
jgi:hypothetical protein